MSKYVWPAEVKLANSQVVLTFPDWPDLVVTEQTVQEAIVSASHLLSNAVQNRVRSGTDVPNPSDLSPRQIPIAIMQDVAAELDKVLSEARKERLKRSEELEKIQMARRAAFLTEFRANLEPTERMQDRIQAGITDYALLGIRTLYLLNAGALIGIPAFIRVLNDRPSSLDFFVIPAILFSIGIVSNILTNYLAFRSMLFAQNGWVKEQDARAISVNSAYYPPTEDVSGAESSEEAREKSRAEFRKGRVVERCAEALVFVTVACFVSGVIFAIFGVESINATEL